MARIREVEAIKNSPGVGCDTNLAAGRLVPERFGSVVQIGDDGCPDYIVAVRCPDAIGSSVHFELGLLDHVFREFVLLDDGTQADNVASMRQTV